MKRSYLKVFLTLLIFSVPMFQVAMTRTRSGVKVQSTPTYVSGIITENTTWTLDCSPYILVADVAVDITVFLTIELGVTVEFTNGTNLIVDGCLIAKGNATNIITFTSNSTSPASGGWGTINIRHYSVGGNIFEYTHIEYASTALTLGADCNITASTFEYNNNGISLQNATNIGIENVQITNNSGYGISGSISQSMEIQRSNISMNGQGASVSSGLAKLSPIVHITDSTFDGNTGDGVDVLDVDPEIDNCSISGNGGNGVGAGAPWVDTPRLKLWNSNVSNNMGAGVTETSYGPESLIDVQNCTFLKNTIGMTIKGSATNCDINGSSQYGVKISKRLSLNKCTISNSSLDGICMIERSTCYIFECDISNNRNGVNMETRPTEFAIIYDSTIRNNSNCGIVTSSGDQISLQNSLVEQSQYGISGPFSLVQLSGCTIRNTAVGVAVTSAQLGASATTIANNTFANIQCSLCTLEHCNIYNSTTNIQCGSGTLEYCNIYDSNVGIMLGSGTIDYCNIFNNTEYSVQDTSSNDVNATYNWWGTTNETLIKQYIYDYYDDPANLGRVFYTPFMTTPIKTENDTVPPVISGISAAPSMPNYDESVVVSATIVDNEAVDHALLSYTTAMTWCNVSMGKSGDVFNATIPAQSWNTAVQYRIYANDTSGNWAESATYSYTVQDFVPPSIVTVKWKPTNPWPYVPSNVTRTDEPTLITANVTEPINASGVAFVQFSYRADGGEWWNTTMTYNYTTQLWTQTIPGESNSTSTVEFFIQAYDRVGNLNISSTYSFQIKHLLLGDINGDGKVNLIDTFTVALQFGKTLP